MRAAIAAFILTALAGLVMGLYTLVSLCQAVSGHVAGCWPHL